MIFMTFLVVGVGELSVGIIISYLLSVVGGVSNQNNILRDSWGDLGCSLTPPSLSKLVTTIV